MFNTDPSRDDQLDVANTLRQGRPELSALELDALQRRVRQRTGMGRTIHDSGTFMRSRNAITALLASGLILTSGGTAIGVSALQSTDNAAIRQYGVPTIVGGAGGDATLAGGGVLNESTGAVTGSGGPGVPADSGVPSEGGGPVTGSGGPGVPAGGGVLNEAGGGGKSKGSEGDAGGVANESASGGPAAGATLVAATQRSRQMASDNGDSLPVTGYAAIPVLLLGAALFAGGVAILRRQQVN